MCAQPPTSAAARSATATAVASTCVLPRPEGARHLRDDAAGVVEHERGGLGAADVDAEPHGRHLATAAGRAGRAPRRASRRRSRCRRRRAASRTRRARRRGPRRAAGRPRRRAGWPAPTARPTTATLRTGRHARPRPTVAPRAAGPHADAADGEVGGAVHLHDRDRAGRGEPGRARLADPERAGDGRAGSVADVTSVRMPGRGIRCAVVDARARTRAAASATRLLGQPPGVHGGHDGGVHRGVGLLGRCPSRGRAGRHPAARARTAASGMPVSALAPAMSRASLTTTPSKPSSSRSTPITVRENVAGRSGSRAETMMCEVITARDPGRDGGPERRELALAQHLERHVDARAAPWCESTDGVAVAGEVLGAGGDAGGLQALDPGGRVAGDERRVVAEAAHADDRVVGGGVDVDVGREVEPDAQRGELVPDAGGRRARVVAGSSSRPSTALPTAVEPGRVVQPGDVAALLVDGEEHARHPLVQGRRTAPASPLGAGDVVAVEAHRHQPLAVGAHQPLGHGGAREAGLEGGRDVRGRGVIPSPPRRRARCSSGPGR